MLQYNRRIMLKWIEQIVRVEMLQKMKRKVVKNEVLQEGVLAQTMMIEWVRFGDWKRKLVRFCQDWIGLDGVGQDWIGLGGQGCDFFATFQFKDSRTYMLTQFKTKDGRPHNLSEYSRPCRNSFPCRF